MVLVGQQLGHYCLVRLIGQGGMGEVYLAEDTRMPSHQVAIKIIRNERQAYHGSPEWQQDERRFKREVTAISQLDGHPNIIGFKDYDEQSVANGSIIYMVMPYCPEGSLYDWLGQHGSAMLAPQYVGQMVMQAASALQHAHDRGIIHRDVKPTNFLVRTNADHPMYPDLLLADFGIVKIMSATATTTRSMGTVEYMAPEQLDGHAEKASDQYALAVMAYQLLTGQRLFQGSMEQVIKQHFNDTPKPPSQFNPCLSPAVDKVILRALAKKADKRFPTIKDFAVELQKALARPVSSSIPFRHSVPSTRLGCTAQQFVSVIFASVQGFPPFRVRLPLNTRIGRLITIITLLLTIGGVLAKMSGPMFITNPNPTATAIASKNAATAIATAGTHMTATATAATDIVPTATAIPPTPTPVLYQYRQSLGTLTWTDSLSWPDDRWQEEGSDPSEGQWCRFVGGVYQISQPQLGTYYCKDHNDPLYSNFVFEVNMTIVNGDCGGMDIRNNDNTGQDYIFAICSDGRYYFKKYASNNGSDEATLRQGNYQGNQSNRIAVEANGGEFDLYVNGQKIDHVSDYGYSQGTIGLLAWNNGDATTVTFQNASLWTL